MYKVVKYYPEIDQSGFRLWRYLLKRDDPMPPPWTTGGRVKSPKLGLTLSDKINLSQTHRQEDNKINVRSDTDSMRMKRKKKKDKELKKRKKKDKELKKEKRDPYHLNSRIKKSIETDIANSKLWEHCKSYLPKGKKKFLKQVLLS